MNYHAEYLARSSTWSDIVDHMPYLFNTVCRFPGAVVLELGVRGGNSTIAFLAAAEQVAGEVWSVDIDRPHVPAWWHTALWHVTIADDLAVFDEQPDGVDVLFIDTSHTYQQTVAELALYADKVRPGGLILLHDTELERPEASPASDPPFPVRVAVTEFCNERGWELELIPGCNGLGIVHVPEVEHD